MDDTHAHVPTHKINIRHNHQLVDANCIYEPLILALITYELRHEISNNVVCATNTASDQPAQRHRLIRALKVQSDQSICKSLEYSMTVNLLTEHHFEFLGLKVGCTGSSESIHVKIQHRWKPHVAAHFHMQLSIGYRDLYLYQIFHLCPHCMCTRSESSDFCAIYTKVPLTASSQSLTFMLLYILPIHLILCFILCLNLHQSVTVMRRGSVNIAMLYFSG